MTEIMRMRQAYNLSREDIASRLGVSYQSVKRWEEGRVVPKKVILMGIELFEQELLKTKGQKIAHG